jgi:hypothetical protein
MAGCAYEGSGGGATFTLSAALARRGWKCGGNGKYPFVGKSDVAAIPLSCANAQGPHVNEKRTRPASNLCMPYPIGIRGTAGRSRSHRAINKGSVESNSKTHVHAISTNGVFAQ